MKPEIRLNSKKVFFFLLCLFSSCVLSNESLCNFLEWNQISIGLNEISIEKSQIVHHLNNEESFQISFSLSKDSNSKSSISFLNLEKSIILQLEFSENELQQSNSNFFFSFIPINHFLWNYTLQIDNLMHSTNTFEFIQIQSIQFQNLLSSNLKICSISKLLTTYEKRQSCSPFYSALGAGTKDGEVLATAFFQNQLYAGGIFLRAGNLNASYIARFDGSNWFTLGLGPTNGTNSDVHALVVYQDSLYVGGYFSQAGGLNTVALARWNGTTWFAVIGSSFQITGAYPTVVLSFSVSNSFLYLAGNFNTTPAGISNIARWDGSNFSGLSLLGTDSYIWTVSTSGNQVYVAGFFTKAGEVNALNVAKWNGSIWSPLSSGVDNIVYDSVIIGNDYFIGGSFETCGGLSIGYVARWNGASWFALGSGVNGIVAAMTSVGTDLYVGGYFSQAGGMAATNIARWNGSSWFPSEQQFGSGPSDYFVYSLVYSNPDLYIGGGFSIVNGTSGINGIVKLEICPQPTPIPTPIPTPNPTPLPLPTAPTPPTPQPTQTISTPTQSNAVSSADNSSTTIIIGVVIAVIVLLICVMIVVIVVLVRRRKNAKKSNIGNQQQQQTDLNLQEKEPSTTYSPVSNSHDNKSQYASSSAISNDSLNNGQYVSSTTVLENTATKLEANELFKKFAIPFSELKIDKELGKGNFGSVYLAFRKSDPNTQIACKQLAKNLTSDTQASTVSEALKKETKSFKDFVAEAKILQSIPPSPYVVRFIGLCADPFCILTEFIDGGSLLEYLTNANSEYTFKIAIGFLKQICKGIAHLHKNGIIHRDLAARNVLLRSKIDEETGVRQCVLVDMGLARLFETGGDYLKTKSPIPLKWTAPEALRDKKFSEKSDMFSFGILAIECFTRETPFPKMSALECAMAISSGRLIPSVKGICPDEFVSLFDPCFSLDPNSRPTASQLLSNFNQK